MNHLEIVVPMAGYGSRFVDAGFTDPKPLIRLADGRRMIEVVIANLTPSRPHRFTFVVRAEHRRDHGLDAVLQAAAPGCQVLEVAAVTRGAAETVLLAVTDLPGQNPLMVANCDQYVDLNIDDYLSAGDSRHGDGFMMTMAADHPKWSYAAVDDAEHVVRVAEKDPISPHATVGIYNFSTVNAFQDACSIMTSAGRMVNGEFYVAPVYNELIGSGAIVHLVSVESLGGRMHGLGVPEDLAVFEKGRALTNL